MEELSILENIDKSSVVKEGLRDLLVLLGAQECYTESELPYDQVFKCLKNNKASLKIFLKNFWDKLTIGEYQAVELPSILPVVEASGKHGYATLADTNIYIANLSKRDNNDLRNEYSPCLDIDLDLFVDKMYYENKKYFYR